MTAPPSPPGEKLAPLLRLAIQVGNQIPARVQEEALRIFVKEARRFQEAGRDPISLGPLFAHLIVHDVPSDHAAGLCLYLARTQDVLDIELLLPEAVAARSAADRHGLLATFMNHIATAQQQIVQDQGVLVATGDTRRMHQTHEPTWTLDVKRLPAPRPPTRAALLEVMGRSRGRLILLTDDDQAVQSLDGGFKILLGRSREAQVQVDDDQASWEHAFIVVEKGRLCLRDAGSQNGLFVNGLGVTERVLEEGDRIQIGAGTTFKFVLLDDIETELLTSLHERSRDDALTGTLGRRALLRRLSAECSHFRRHARELCLLRVDVDRLSHVNSERGAQVGDQALVHVARVLAAELREEDEVGRLSGQEFLCVLRETGDVWAMQVADRLREAVARMAVPEVRPPLHVTVSIGLVSAIRGQLDRPQSLLDAAGELVRAAKVSGRNQVSPSLDGGFPGG